VACVTHVGSSHTSDVIPRFAPPLFDHNPLIALQSRDGELVADRLGSAASLG